MDPSGPHLDLDELTAPAADPLLGVVVASRYLILEQIGAGGFGHVYRAKHLGLGRLVALKVLRGGASDDPVMLERFRREARAAAAIDHPGVVAVSDFGQMSNGSPYLVMEWVEGTHLADRLQRRGPLGPAAATSLMARVARALEVAHAAGVVHRDLKPENLLLDADGQVKVGDFGLCAFLGGLDKRLTAAGQVLGTPYYFAPERFEADLVCEQSDVYSFGCILFEILTGERPFEARLAVELLKSHLIDTPRRASEVARRPVPAALDDLIADCLAKEADDRPTMAEVAARLERPDVCDVSEAAPWSAVPASPRPLALRAAAISLIACAVVAGVALGAHLRGRFAAPSAPAAMVQPAVQEPAPITPQPVPPPRAEPAVEEPAVPAPAPAQRQRMATAKPRRETASRKRQATRRIQRRRSGDPGAPRPAVPAVLKPF